MTARLEALARGGAVFFGAAYAAGFVIVTLHHARYGVLQFDLLRPRVLAAGVVFLLLLALPIYVSFFLFNISWLEHANKGLSDKPEHQFLLRICAASQSCTSLLFLAWIAPFQSLLESWSLVPIIASWVKIGVWAGMSRWFGRSPRMWISADCLATLGLFVATAIYLRSAFFLGLWFSVVGVFAVFLHYVSRDREMLRGVRWDTEFLLLGTLMLTLYAAQTYGKIGVAYGGGAPGPVTVHFVGENPIAQAKVLKARLLDETDRGYYLLLGDDASPRPAFIAREQVLGIEFGGKERVSRPVAAPSMPPAPPPPAPSKAPAPPPPQPPTKNQTPVLGKS